MPRIKNTRPTIIYFLFDARPEKISEGWPFGEAFYCGKTVKSSAGERLSEHKTTARKWPNRSTSKRLRECGEHVAIRVMETVPPESDWVARERHWIAILRHSFPGTTNVSAGGAGHAGVVFTAEHRAKISASLTGKKRSAEHCANLSEAKKGKKLPPRSPECRAKISEANRNRKYSSETRAKLSAANKGRKQSPEWIAKNSAARKGKKRGPYRKRETALRLDFHETSVTDSTPAALC